MKNVTTKITFPRLMEFMGQYQGRFITSILNKEVDVYE